MIKQESIEYLKQKLDIVDVISSRIEIKRGGANYKGLCPFHDEKTPSFTISPHKQIYHCFGCGASGDSIKFVMEYERLDYKEAMEKLALEHNVILEYTTTNKNFSSIDETLKKINNFFKKSIEAKKDIKEYLSKRGIYKSSIEKFEIGYGPTTDKILEYLYQNTNMPKKDLFYCGILSKDKYDREYCIFSQRIMFPIRATNSKIVGFGGRTTINSPAKYINSKATRMFDKSKLLYNYHMAQNYIYKKEQIIIVEGYIDVIMLHQAGFKNSVATLGTALTVKHLPLIKRGDLDVILAYDGDDAGRQAAYKASLLLSKSSTNGGVVIFENGEDPADLVKDGKNEKLYKLFSQPIPFAKFCLSHIVGSFDINNPIKKARALDDGVTYLKTLTPILQNEYKNYLAALLNLDKNFIHISKRNIKKNQELYENMDELSIIKTALNNRKLLNVVISKLEISMFKIHKEEFGYLLNESFEKLNALIIRDDIKIYCEDELNKQLNKFLIIYYLRSQKEIKNRKNIHFEKKSFLIRELKDKIDNLKKNNLN